MRDTVTGSELKSCALFSLVPKKDADEMARVAQLRTLAAHERVYHANEKPKNLIVVRSGSLAITNHHGLSEITVVHLYPGSWWGGECLINLSKTYPLSLWNDADTTEIIEIPFAKLIRFLYTHADTKLAVTDALAKALDRALSEQNRRLAALDSVYRTLADDTIGGKLERALISLADNTRARKALLTRFNPSADLVTVHAAAGIPLSRLSWPLSADTVLGTLFATEQPFHITPETYEAKFDLMPYAAETLLAVPLRMSSLAGALVVTHAHGRGSFSRDDEQLLMTVAPLFAALLITSEADELSRLHEQLKRTYITPLARF